ncbi:MAG: ribosome-associated heat shock protein Hsp15 [Halomonadaceae bacterium]|nr:MAG: ribosome-associated heat shock protein Hsp15 [Halomonadaceae bacterium]
MSNQTPDTHSDQKVRLDKWLWAARFFKTRNIAREAVDGGKVRYDDQRAKPGKAVAVGARIRLRQGVDDREVIVEALSDKRRGAPEAQLLYRETDTSLSQREDAAWRRKTLQAATMPPPRRPTKKQRRDIQRFKDNTPE